MTESAEALREIELLGEGKQGQETFLGCKLTSIFKISFVALKYLF